MSSQRLSRKEIKHDIRDDALRHAVGESYDYVRGHRRNLVLAIAGVVLVAGAFAGWRAWNTRREATASDALGHAIAAYDGAVVPADANPDDLDSPTFPDEKSKQARAKQLFEQVAKDYPRTGGAAVAEVYLGRIRFQEGDTAGARKVWQDFLDAHPEHMLAAAVRRTLLDLDRKEGKGEQVVQRLRADLEKEEKPLPEDVILFELGTTLEQLGRKQEAHDAYQRVVDEYPDSAWVSKATQKVRELGSPAGVG
ncbi:MAG TPA: tetratricopeptide repeat protein [Thermoanaerobaculia bacterium]|jgi:TolA-binding protein|nr:tetratricopeptide repeat protein [Thermoanaerobaculia bacterium]